jgi:hypothetical protein
MMDFIAKEEVGITYPLHVFKNSLMKKKVQLTIGS